MLLQRINKFSSKIKWLFVLLPIVVIILLTNSKKAYSQEINIISPTDGDTFNPGEAITVVVEQGDGISLKHVFVMFDGDLGPAGFDDSAPFEIPVTLPRELGAIVLRAMGRDQTESAFETTITLNLATTAILQEIIPNSRKLNFAFPSEEQSISPTGLYSDGMEIGIAIPSTGTTYRTLSGTDDVVQFLQQDQLLRKGTAKKLSLLRMVVLKRQFPLMYNLQIHSLN